MEEMVLEGLLFGDRDVQVMAAREFCNFTNTQRHRLINRGIVSPLLSMLDHTRDYEVIEAALHALLSLAFGSERNKVHIVESGAVPVLLRVLRYQHESPTELAIAALLVLSSCKANKQAIAAYGAIQLLVEFLDSNFNGYISEQAKLDIISTLQNLSTSTKITRLIVSSGIVISLLQLICDVDKSCELAEKAMSLLDRTVSTSEEALAEAGGISGAIQVLVEAMEEGSAQCKEDAIGILLLLCQSCRERYRGMILREGAMPALLQLSLDGTWKAKERAEHLLRLLRDSAGSPSGNKQSKNVLMEEAMDQIDRGADTSLRLVEEMIAKLRT